MRIQNLCDGADFAHKLEISDVVTHMGFIPENPYDPNFDSFCDAVHAVASHLKKNDQFLLFETGQETPVAMMRCFEKVNCDNLGVNLDTANLILYGKANPVDALDVFRKYVRNIHAKDGRYPVNGHDLGEETKIGEGKVNFHALFVKLRELGYDSHVTIEREIEGEQQLVDILDSKNYLQQIIDDMLANENLDILDICLPTCYHAEYSIKAMEHGIHVVCEKPVSLHIEDIDSVYTAAEKNHVKYMIAQVLRFWPEYRFLKNIFDTQKYGSLLSGSMSRLGGIPKWSWDNWMRDEKRSGLVPFDLHIHDLDFIRYAFGSPQKMYPHRAKRPEQDYIQVTYQFEDFFITTEASWFSAPYPFTAEYRFQFEHAIVAYEHGKCLIYEDNGNIIDASSNATGETGDINLPKSDAYANELRYFTDCVINDVFPEKVKQEELKDVLTILKKL